jgi:phosphate transport system substrate-binding protein
MNDFGVRGLRAAAVMGVSAAILATATVQAAEVTLVMKGGDFSVKGDLKSFDGLKYTIESKQLGIMSLDASRFDCASPDCPKAPTTGAAAPGQAAAPAGNLGTTTWMGGSAQGTQVMPKLIQAYAATIGATVTRAVASDPRNLEFKLTDATGRELGAFNVHRLGVPEGLVGLEKKSVDVVWSARAITPEEQQKAQAVGLGNLRAPGNENVYALNAMVTLVAPSNPAVSLSIDTIAKIYAGQIKDWSELGFPAGKINVYSMVTSSGYWAHSKISS